MGTSLSVEQFVGKIERAGASIGKTRREQFVHVGEQMVEIHAEVVDAKIGGTTFSGWPKNPLIGQAKATPDTLEFRPKPGSRGSERVAQSGRHPGMAGPMQGPQVTSGGKSGVRKVGRARRKKWNGSTTVKETWTSTTEAFGKVIPPKLNTAFVAPLKEIFH